MARSIAHKPKILLLENALEQLNAKERRRIIDFLTSDQNPWTLVAISSDPYFAHKLERVLVMEDGKIIEDDGDNQSLLPSQLAK